MRPFLEGKSKTTLEYYKVSCERMEHRIKTRMKDIRGEDVFLDELDKIWYSATDEELQEIEELPRQWWFQHLDSNGQITQQSELDIYPYAQCFVKQRPHLLGDDVSHMKGKPFFGGEWLPNRPFMYFLISEEVRNEELNEMCNTLRMVTMTNNSYQELQNKYDFIGYAHTAPIFKLRGSNE